MTRLIPLFAICVFVVGCEYGDETYSRSKSNQQSGYDTLQQSGYDTLQQSGYDTLQQSGYDTLQQSGYDTLQQSGYDTLQQSGYDTLQQSGYDTLQQSDDETPAAIDPGPVELSPEEVVEEAFPSVVLLAMQDENSQPISLGSGFFVEPGVIATNLHVVEGASAGYAKLVGQENKQKIGGILAVDQRRDLALLSTSDSTVEPLTLDSVRADIGSEVYAIGNPEGLEGTFSEGIVSGVRNFEDDAILQVTAPISSGSSGGPVLNSRGKVIGIATATFAKGQNLNFAVPAKYVMNLTAEGRTLEPLDSDERNPKKSIFAGVSEPSKSVTAGQFLWDESFDDDYDRDQGYSFSVRNHSGKPISDVLVMVVFYNSEDKPLESQLLSYGGTISPNLASRVSGSVDYSIKKLTTAKASSLHFKDKPYTKVDFRVLDFEVVQ